MKANELMIGDWVIHRFGFNGKVTKIDLNVVTIYDQGFDDGDGHYEVTFAWNEIKPIPLTVEILEKNGFEKTEEASYERVFIWFKGGFELNGLELVKLESWDWYKYGYNVKISYVHQLQHLLRLCGIEKEIEL